MQKWHTPSPFALAGKSLATALPKHIMTCDEDYIKIKLPSYRHDAIKDAVLKMYEKTNVRKIPLPVLDIVCALGYSIIPYRAYGQRFNDVFLETSIDAISCQFRGSPHPIILYNDRQPSTRVNFSILHEVGHIELGHKEQSQLAEIEANYFAATALCPTELLEHYKITEVQKVAKVFNISCDCAQYRLRALSNSLDVFHSTSALKFKDSIIERFEDAFPVDLFGEYIF